MRQVPKRRPKKESLILGQMLRRIAPRVGVKVQLEPEWHFVGQITLRNGRKSYFRYNTVDLNGVGSSEIAKDKGWADYFMKRMGYRTIPRSKTFFSEEWAKAIGRPGQSINAAFRHARKIGFPVVVKPNSGSQGKGFEIVYTKSDLIRALKFVFKEDRVAIVQPVLRGRDFRLVVLDNEVISAYERIPLGVVGNGRETILQLLKRKQKRFVADRRDTQIRFDDPRIRKKLRRQGLTFKSIPKSGEQIYLLDNANLSTGGDAVDVTKQIHRSFRDLAVRLTRDMGLRLCGVDLMINGDIGSPIDKYWILEINAAPGLDHYARTGREQARSVEAMYTKVLEHLNDR